MGARGIENGDFKLSADEFLKAEELIGYLDQIADVLKAIKGSRRALTTTLSWCMRIEGVDTKRLIGVLQRKYPNIRPVVDTEYLLYDISKIYNDGLKTKSKRIYFDVIFRNLR